MVTQLSDIQGPKAPEGVFRAIADPTRRAILDGLSGGERTAGEIAGDFGVSRPAISKHLKLLEEVGLVRVEKVGRERRFRADPTPLADVERWAASQRLAMARRLVDLKAHLESNTNPGPAPEGDPS